MKVLVLGGTGWLGHHVVRKFVAAGHEVLAGCRGGKKTYLADCADLPIAHFDKTNEEDMKRVLASGYEVVIDTVPGKVTMDLIAKYAVGLRHYIHCSSTGGYTPLPYVPCDENAPFGGFSFGGGWTEKAILDSYAMELHAKTGFPATSIRPSYITGIGMVPITNLGGRENDFMANVIAGKITDLPNDGQALLQPGWAEDLAMPTRATAQPSPPAPPRIAVPKPPAPPRLHGTRPLGLPPPP
ncbi:MAG: NAD-dependent epimerase/dehydratase family protein, partial [Victivallaceae bacterium]|nr:NAD-dependent epimerase/dehydratase family protein [Victivallaceae bacterium]